MNNTLSLWWARLSWLKPILVFFLHLAVLFIAYKLLLFMSLVTRVESVGQFKQWDSFWYASIAENGYQYSDTQATNSGFFPLFSYTWKFLWKIGFGGVHAICYFNLVIFYMAMLLLKKAFNFSWLHFLLFLSVPSNMFMYVPYSEAVFFFFSTLIIVGLKKDNKAMIFIGLFFASLARPTAVFFIPAIICMEVFAYENAKKFIKNLLAYGAMPLLGLLAVTVVQYFQTGTWFAYFKAQSVMWKRTMQVPELPFTTWDGPRMLWLDSVGLFFGLLAAALLIGFLVRKFRNTEIIKNDKAVFFSLCYLMMAMLSVVFFNGKDVTGGTSLMAANRYVLATPFFVIMLYMISHQLSFQADVWIIYLLTAVLLYFLMRVEGPAYTTYDVRDKFYYRFLVIASVLMYVLTARFFNNRFLAMIYLVNVFTQVIIMNEFASGKWIG